MPLDRFNITLHASLLAAALGLGTVGCRGDQATEAKTDGAEQPHTFNPDAKVIVDHSEQRDPLVLVEPGAEPRAVLRYADQAPSRSVALTMMTGQLVADQPMMDYVVTWTGVEPDGESRRYLYDVVSANYAGEFAELSHASEMEARIQEGVRRAQEGIAGQAVGSATGLERVVQTHGSSNATPSIGALIPTIAMTVPNEPVGVGAVWTQTIRYEQGATEARYTLLERDGDLVTIAYESIDMHDEAANVESVISKGRFVVALTDPLPRSGSLAITVRIVFPDSEGQPGTSMDVQSGWTIREHAQDR